MRCLAVCQTELAIRMLDEILLPKLRGRVPGRKQTGRATTPRKRPPRHSRDLRRTDTYLKADLTPGTCVVVEDNGKRSLKKVLEAIWDAGGTLVYVLGIGAPHTRKREDELKAQFPELNYLALSELFGGPLLTEFSRSLTRLKVQQYQRFFADADRVVIVLHNDPDPDAMASGLALRNVLRRTKQTAVLAALQGVTRPENQRMMNLLDIQVEILTPEQVPELRSDRDGRRPAARISRPHRPRGSGHRPPSRAAGLHGSLQGHPRGLRLHLDDPDGAPARDRRQHLRADRDRDALRDQVRHAVLQPPGEPGRHRGVLLSLSARRRDADPEDGRRGNHDGAARIRAEGQAARPDGRAGVLRVSRRRRRARTSFPTSRISICSSRT